jgi:hypothetical protein
LQLSKPSCRPNKSLAGIQEAVLRTTERIIGDDSPGGLKLPHKATLRMLLFKYQIGAVMGKKGAAINEIRNKSGATVKLTTPQPGTPIVPCAEKDDELLTVSSTRVCRGCVVLWICACWAYNQCSAAAGIAWPGMYSMHRTGVSYLCCCVFLCMVLLHCVPPTRWLALVDPWLACPHICLAASRHAGVWHV